MKTLHILTALIYMIFCDCNGQEKIHYSQILEAAIKLPSNTDIKKITVDEKSNSELFIVYSSDKKFKYILTLVSKKESIDFSKPSDTEEYKKAYLQECKCTIESEHLIKFHNFLSYRFKTVNYVQDQKLYGYTDSFIFKQKTVSVIYLTNDDFLSKKYISEYKSFLDQIDDLENR